MNKYQERVLNKAKETGARIVLPEIGDKRVQEAIIELTTLGFKIVHIADFQDNTDIYLDFLNTLPFTENWPAENLREYLKEPLHCAMAMVACDDADGLAAGQFSVKGNVLRKSRYISVLS
jgi:phosphotransacetylase